MSARQHAWPKPPRHISPNYADEVRKAIRMLRTLNEQHSLTLERLLRGNRELDHRLAQVEQALDEGE